MLNRDGDSTCPHRWTFPGNLGEKKHFIPINFEGRVLLLLKENNGLWVFVHNKGHSAASGSKCFIGNYMIDMDKQRAMTCLHGASL